MEIFRAPCHRSGAPAGKLSERQREFFRQRSEDVMVEKVRAPKAIPIPYFPQIISTFEQPGGMIG